MFVTLDSDRRGGWGGNKRQMIRNLRYIAGNDQAVILNDNAGLALNTLPN